MKKKLLVITILSIVAIFTILILFNFSMVKKLLGIGADVVGPTAGIQTIYQDGVPQVDFQGNILHDYDPDKSFFPIGIYNPDSKQALDKVIAPSNGFNLGVLPSTFALHENCAEGEDLTLGFSNCIDAILNEIGDSANPDFKIILSNKNTDYCTDASCIQNGLAVAPDTSKILPSFPVLENNNGKKNIFAWYLADEPLDRLVTLYDPATAQYTNLSNGPLWANFFNTLSERIKARGVTKPLFVTNTSNISAPNSSGELNTPDGVWHSFSTIGDIAVLDNYPTNQKWVRRDPNLEIASLDRPDISSTIAKTVQATVADNDQQKPMWLVVQASKPHVGSDGTETRFPTPNEERAMVYSGIISGATGIIYYSWDSPELLRATEDKYHEGISPDSGPICPTNIKAPGDSCITEEDHTASLALWDEITGAGGINSEINQLSPVILSKTSKLEYSVNATEDLSTLTEEAKVLRSGAPIRTMLKEYNGSYYLLAVNVNNNSSTATFNFPANTLGGQVKHYFLQDVVNSDNQTFTDTFSPFQTHVYSFPKIDDAPPTINSINITDGQVISANPYHIQVTATDDIGISKVQFYIDDIQIGENTLPDVNGVYETAWDTSKYHSEVKVVAVDTSGKTASLTRNTTVNLSQNNSGLTILPKTGRDKKPSVYKTEDIIFDLFRAILRTRP